MREATTTFCRKNPILRQVYRLILSERNRKKFGVSSIFSRDAELSGVPSAEGLFSRSCSSRRRLASTTRTPLRNNWQHLTQSRSLLRTSHCPASKNHAASASTDPSCSSSSIALTTWWLLLEKS